VIPIGSRIISGFIGRNLEKLNIILIFILKTPIRQFIMECLIGVLLKILKTSWKVPINAYEK